MLNSAKAPNSLCPHVTQFWSRIFCKNVSKEIWSQFLCTQTWGSSSKCAFCSGYLAAVWKSLFFPTLITCNIACVGWNPLSHNPLCILNIKCSICAFAESQFSLNISITKKKPELHEMITQDSQSACNRSKFIATLLKTCSFWHS